MLRRLNDVRDRLISTDPVHPVSFKVPFRPNLLLMNARPPYASAIQDRDPLSFPSGTPHRGGRDDRRLVVFCGAERHRSLSRRDDASFRGRLLPESRRPRFYAPMAHTARTRRHAHRTTMALFLAIGAKSSLDALQLHLARPLAVRAGDRPELHDPALCNHRRGPDPRREGTDQALDRDHRRVHRRASYCGPGSIIR